MNPSALNIGQDSVVVYTLTPDLDALQDHRLFTRDELCVATSFIAEAPQVMPHLQMAVFLTVQV